jgi:hypothetical protein
VPPWNERKNRQTGHQGDTTDEEGVFGLCLAEIYGMDWSWTGGSVRSPFSYSVAAGSEKLSLGRYWTGQTEAGVM